MSAKSKPGKILAVDWDAKTLRIVHASIGRRGIKVERLLSVAIPTDIDPDSPEQMGGTLRRALEQERISTRHAIVDVPREQAILNTLTLPLSAVDALPSMVAIQVGKQLPFAVSDAVIDFAVAPKADGAVSGEILVAAVRHEVVAQYQAVFSSAGLKLERIGLRPNANKIAACELLRDAMPERVLMIDVRPTLTEISVIRKGFLAFSRAASVHIDEDESLSMEASAETPALTFVGSGTESDRRKAKAVNALAAEVMRSVEAYRATDAGAKIDHAVIGGDIGVEEELAEALQQRLGITTELYNPARTFRWEPDEGARAVAFAATLGLVLGYTGDAELQFDFLHPKKTVTATERRLKKAPLAAAVGLLFLAAGGVALARMSKPDRDKLAAIEAKIKELENNVKEKDKFIGLVEEQRKFDQDQHVWVDVLHDLIGRLPNQEEMVITQMDLNQKEGRVVLKTRTRTMATAHEALQSLNAFRRESSSTPRFKAGMGNQADKAGDRYPTSQDLRITLLSDEVSRSAAKKDTRK